MRCGETLFEMGVCGDWEGGLFMYDGPVETAECIWMNVGYRLD